MTVSVGISTAGNFVTQEYVYSVFGKGGTPEDAGVTDMALFNKMNQASQSGSNCATSTMQFLDSLSPSQLDEVTLGCFNDGPRVTTYGDYKTYMNLVQDLGDQIDELTKGDTTPLNQLTASSSNPSEAEAVKVDDLLADVVNNKPGCITAAESYLEDVGGASSSATSSAPAPTATAASGKAASASSATSLTSAEIQEIFAHHATEGSGFTAASMATWDTASKDTVMDTADSNRILDIADGLDTEA